MNLHENPITKARSLFPAAAFASFVLSVEREATEAPSAPAAAAAAAGPVFSLHPVDSLADRASAKHRSAENAGEAVASSPPSAA
jgi:hypothetical protein